MLLSYDFRCASLPQICAYKEWNLDGLLEKIWDHLDLLRIYTKPKGLLPDYNEPVVVPHVSTLVAAIVAGAPVVTFAWGDTCLQNKNSVEDFCNRIHKGLMKDFKHALVWGTSVKHRPQRVGKDHRLEDEDVVQIVKVGSTREPAQAWKTGPTLLRTLTSTNASGLFLRCPVLCRKSETCHTDAC